VPRAHALSSDSDDYDRSSDNKEARMGLRRFSTSKQCRLETKGFHALGLRLNHDLRRRDPDDAVAIAVCERYR
jgi:hypothetical protein